MSGKSSLTFLVVVMHAMKFWSQVLLCEFKRINLCFFREPRVKISNVAGCRPVVVLADREKEEMDDELRHSLKGYSIEWHTRSGAPHCSSDLERVAAGQAKNVILLDNNVEVPTRQQCPLMRMAIAKSTNTILVEGHKAYMLCDDHICRSKRVWHPQ